MKNNCGCGHCDYCEGHRRAQMDIEFGGADRGKKPVTVADTVRNMVCYQQRIDMCDEFGYPLGGAAAHKQKLKDEYYL